MEAVVAPARWANLGPAAGLFQALRSEEGERMVLDGNFFVETLLPQGVLRALSEDEMAHYRTPFLEPNSRLPTLVWPREIPIEGEPVDVQTIVENYGRWLSQSTCPKLLIAAVPGVTVTGPALEFCRTWRNQREVTVQGRHFLQEDSPDEVGIAIARFVSEVRE